MSRIFIAVVVVVLLFGGIVAADQALQNPDLEPAEAGDAAEQAQFAETSAQLVEVGVPIVLFGLVAGGASVAIRTLGGA